jgi:hypothetical protein
MPLSRTGSRRAAEGGVLRFAAIFAGRGFVYVSTQTSHAWQNALGEILVWMNMLVVAPMWQKLGRTASLRGDRLAGLAPVDHLCAVEINGVLQTAAHP